jgi:hypothetical protein
MVWWIRFLRGPDPGPDRVGGRDGLSRACRARAGTLVRNDNRGELFLLFFLEPIGLIIFLKWRVPYGNFQKYEKLAYSVDTGTQIA